MITIRGHEFEFNFLDAKDIEKWVEGRKKVSEKYNDLKKYQLKKNSKLYLPKKNIAIYGNIIKFI